MKNTHLLNLILVLTSTGVLKHEDDVKVEDLMTFQDGQDLRICDILDAPGEVIGKSNYGTLYKAFLQSSNSVRLLRFFRPVCTAKVEDFGPRGEKLLIHPFYWRGNLSQFVRESNPDSHKWAIIYRISVDIEKGLDHLHTGLEKTRDESSARIQDLEREVGERDDMIGFMASRGGEAEEDDHFGLLQPQQQHQVKDDVNVCDNAIVFGFDSHLVADASKLWQ
ncbi:PREDICTED: putative kinase TMKL1, partial [Prunus dulcis]